MYKNNVIDWFKCKLIKYAREIEKPKSKEIEGVEKKVCEVVNRVTILEELCREKNKRINVLMVKNEVLEGKVNDLRVEITESFDLEITEEERMEK